MNAFDIILIIVIAAALAAAIHRVIKNRRQGKLCSGCCGECSSCMANIKKGGYQ